MSNHQTASALAYLNPDFCFIMDDNSMELLADAPRTRQEHVIRFDELPGAKIIGRAVEVRHIFEWAKKGTDNEEE